MIKVVELFGGIGAFTNALRRLNLDYQVLDYVEIDKNSVKSYNKLYNAKFEPKDIREYSLIEDKIDILMHGSPCQDFSSLGYMKGGEKGSNTRSSLLFETVRIIKNSKYKPRWIIWENVFGALTKKMKSSFFNYIEELKSMGYETKYEILNSMDFGIPQKRNRVFAVSYLGSNLFDFNSLERQPKRDITEFLENERVDDKYIVKQNSILNHLEYLSLLKRNLVEKKKYGGKCSIIEDFVYTITTKQMRIPNAGLVDLGNNKYRYLTERECFRFMGFSDEDFNKLREIYPVKPKITSSILYRQAGNSIVVDVLMAIIKEIRRAEGKEVERKT